MDEANALTFTTLGSLGSCVDKKLVCVLRDGRKFIGVLRSFDQFANLILQDTVERVYADSVYGDIPRGIFIVRGENVVMLGEIDLDREEAQELEQSRKALTQVSAEEALARHKSLREKQKAAASRKNAKLFRLGFSTDFDEDELC